MMKAKWNIVDRVILYVAMVIVVMLSAQARYVLTFESDTVIMVNGNTNIFRVFLLSGVLSSIGLLIIYLNKNKAIHIMALGFGLIVVYDKVTNLAGLGLVLIAGAAICFKQFGALKEQNDRTPSPSR